MKGIVFDMDGIIIDSEPFWRAAEMETFKTAGCILTESDCMQTTGLSVPEVVKFWHERRDLSGADHNLLATKIRAGVMQQIREFGKPKPGILRLLDQFKSRGLPIGLASGSEYEIIDTVLHRLGIRGYFQTIVSTEEFPLGKPHPAVYLEACKRLSIPSASAIALEDSVNGMVAAKAARMTCVVIPEGNSIHDQRFGLADAVISCADEFSASLWDSLTAKLL